MKINLPHLTWRRSLSVLAALAVMTGAAACASSGGSGDGSNASGGGSVVRIATFYPDQSTALPIYVAEQEGYFKKQGVTVQQVDVTDGDTAAQALLSGSADMANEAAFHVLPSIAQGEPLQFVAGLESQYNVELVVSPQVHIPSNSSYTAALQALKGKKVGITSPGSAQYYTLVYALEAAGLKPSSDVTLVSLGGTLAGDLAALQSGRIDAFMSYYPQTDQFVTAGDAKIAMSFWSGSRPPLLTNLMDAGLAATTSYISSHKSAVNDVHAAIAEADKQLNALNQNSATALAKVLAPDFQGIPQAQVVATLLAYKSLFQPWVSQANIDNSNSIMIKFQALKSPISYQTAVNPIAQGS